LKFLIRLCSDLGLKEATEYALELKKAEKAKEVRERIGSSRPGKWLLLLLEIHLSTVSYSVYMEVRQLDMHAVEPLEPVLMLKLLFKYEKMEFTMY
jgi:hypothetical protein